MKSTIYTIYLYDFDKTNEPLSNMEKKKAI